MIQLKPLQARWFELINRLPRPTRREVGWALAAVPALFLLYVLVLIPLTPAISDIRKARQEQPARLLSADGKLLGEYKWANRAWVPLDQIAPSVVTALVATEDHRFYSHFGLDWRRTASAALSTLSGERQGGSTITQQLAKNLFLSGERTLLRKGQEFVLTLLLEALLSKERILEIYLNSVEWGDGVFGAEAAAQHYFKKPAARLTPQEAARLAVMLPAPKRFEKMPGSAYLAGRTRTIVARMGSAELP